MEEIFKYNRTGFLPEFNIGEISWRSLSMQNIMDKISQIAQSKSRIFIRGEIGTGKTMIAKMIHNLSSLKDFPFYSFDSIFLNETVLKNLIADKSSQKSCDSSILDIGTLFFRDIEALNLENQYKVYCLVKNWEEKNHNFRIIASTKSNMRNEINGGNFIEEFYYYLNVIYIHVTPLRERQEDIEPLVEYISQLVFNKLGRQRCRFEPEEISKLYNLELKGNMLEVANLVERAIVLSPGDSKKLSFIDLYSEKLQEEEFSSYSKDFSDHKDDFLRRTIADAIKKSRGRKKEAAKNLGMSPRALSYYISKYDIS